MALDQKWFAGASRSDLWLKREGLLDSGEDDNLSKSPKSKNWGGNPGNFPVDIRFLSLKLLLTYQRQSTKRVPG